eukprot:SAG11_NODE_4_length_33019_cov_28.098909_32_plen_138_part_00
MIKRNQRLHLFICDEQREALLEKIVTDAATLIGHYIAEPSIDRRTLEKILEHRHEVSYTNEAVGAVRFEVYKKTMRYEAPIPRRLCLSGYKLAELDADTNGLVSVHHMATVFAVVSDPGEQQWMTIEFMDGSTLHYM